MIWTIKLFVGIYFLASMLMWMVLGTSIAYGLPIWVKGIHFGLIVLGAIDWMWMFIKYEILGRGPK